MQRLYVLISNKLDSIYGCVQGGHAVAQWLLEHPNQEWNNNYCHDIKKYYLDDGMHLNKIGYTRLDSCIAKHIIQQTY